MATRKSYSNSFKEKAVRMVIEENRRLSEVSKELNISANLLTQWKRKYLEANIESTSKGKDTAGYIRDLEREVKRLKEERDILKKAAIYFAKPSK